MKKAFQLQSFISRHLSPKRIFIPGFGAYILLGTLLLWFPFSAAKGPLSFIDVLLTSTSAVCVTDLATIDIAKGLSFAGQVIAVRDVLSNRVHLVPRADFVIKDSDILTVIGGKRIFKKSSKGI